MRRFLTSRPVQFIGVNTNVALTVSTTAVGIGAGTVPNGASGGWVCCDTMGGGVKFALGTAPATNWGFDLGPGDVFEVRDNIDIVSKMQFVRVTSTDGRISFIPFIE